MVPLTRREKTDRIVAIALMVICITILHYRSDHFNIASQVLFRELYFLPIILAGFWFGVPGGVGASLSVTLLYLPYVLALPEGIGSHKFGNLIQIILFNLFGLLFGLLFGRHKRQQQKLLEAENLAAMGRAVSCIAHDMKTPLMAIGGFVQQVQRKMADDKLIKKLDIAVEQVRRLEALVGDMLAFAKPLNLQWQQGAVNDLIHEVVMISGEKASRQAVTIATELQEGMPTVEYDAQRLQQALLNLVNNALEASPQGGKVVLRSQANGTCITIEIIDRGDGIPKERQDDIFTPFVTTKKEGTGLGLSIVKKVIEAHAGSITVSKNSEKGVTFRITIPLTSHERG